MRGITNTRCEGATWETLTRERALRQQIALLGMYRETCPKPVADGHQVVQHDSGIVARDINLNAVREMGERLVNDLSQQQLNLGPRVCE